ncbi:MAG: PEP/pyruvate-binding domain-containing protein, partial [Pseudomonadota bacterium]
MGRERNFLSRLNMKARPSDASGAGDLRAEFNKRYQSFRRLLNANKRSLAAMVEIEAALRGDASPDMERVRGLCAGATADVREMIDNLGSLAPGKYDRLNERFRKIEKNVRVAVHPESVEKEGPLVLHLSVVDRDMADQVGMKMANLGELRGHLRLTVPNGFVITAQACRRFMEQGSLQE